MEKKRTKIAYFTAVGVFLVLLVVLGLTYRETPLPTLEVEGEPVLCTVGLAAACSGGVMGDHCSPISDTTIMASAGAHCFHLNHVFTQLPYALTASGVAFVSFIIAGLVQSVWLCLAIAVALMIGTLLVIRAIVSRRHAGIFQEMAQASQQLLHR